MLTSVLFFTAKGAELKSAIISEMDKQNRPSWQVWLGATEGRQAAYCPPTRNDVSVKGCCMVEAACEVNLSRHTAESSRVVVFTETLQVRREWGLAQCGTHFLAEGEEPVPRVAPACDLGLGRDTAAPLFRVTRHHHEERFVFTAQYKVCSSLWSVF